MNGNNVKASLSANMGFQYTNVGGNSFLYQAKFYSSSASLNDLKCAINFQNTHKI